MTLRIKEDYKEWSIGGGKSKKIKLTNLDPSLYETYFKIYPEFFEVIEPKAPVAKTQNNKDIKDDTDK